MAKVDKDLKKHFSHYVPLIGIYIAAIIGFVIFSYDKDILFGISVALASAYISWGIIHHYIHHDLTIGVLFEYVGVAALGLTVLSSIIYWI